jgi:transcriptional regulator with XRE-family HTH domain
VRVAFALQEALRGRRIERRLSQGAVARHAGITQGSLSNYETLKRVMPVSTAWAVSLAVGCGLSELLDSVNASAMPACNDRQERVA